MYFLRQLLFLARKAQKNDRIPDLWKTVEMPTRARLEKPALKRLVFSFVKI